MLGATLASPVRAADFSTGGAFLSLGHGARLHGLGNAGVALLRDDAAVFWNPANLAWMQQANGVTLMHADILDGIDDGYDSVSFGRRAGARLGFPQQPLRPTRWGYGFFIAHMGFDFASGNRWSETTFLFGAAYSLNNYTSIGIGLKGLSGNNDFQSADASGAGLDLALSLLVMERVTLAVVGRDVWTRLRWDTSRWETLAPSVTFGLEVRPAKRWSGEVDLVLREGTLQKAAAGVEWQAYRDLFWVRGGITHVAPGEARLYPSAGAGLRFSRCVLDYGVGFDEDDALGIGQRLSLRVMF